MSVMMNGDGDFSVAQAQGMASVQAECSLSKALLLMRAGAASSDLSLANVAKAVLDGTLRFSN